MRRPKFLNMRKPRRDRAASAMADMSPNQGSEVGSMRPVQTFNKGGARTAKKKRSQPSFLRTRKYA